jgi:hypothetical protein
MSMNGLIKKMGVLVALIAFGNTLASDHDDGERELKGRNLNITDVYAFNEASQTGADRDKENIILVMNTNPRSLPEQQYYFSTKARYSFHLSRVQKKTAVPKGVEDVRIDLLFDAPKNGKQAITVELWQDGKLRKTSRTTSGALILTTPLADSQADNNRVNTVSIDGKNLSIFAGLREDPFFFDVEQFFKVRGAAVKTGKLTVGFAPVESARDFTKNYNVNSIALKIPRSLIHGPKKSTVYDVWTTLSLYSYPGRRWTQIERLGRPAVNEGLLITNSKLNAFNSIPPSQDLNTNNSTILSVLQEASASLDLFDSLDGREDHANGFDSAVVKGFLPDVMRIDSAIVLPVSTAGYNGDFVVNDGGAAMLTGGRKIEDDVVDITLSYLISGDPTGATIQDNVSYAGVSGNPSQGHRYLHGQTQRGGKATFPFLARPH